MDKHEAQAYIDYFKKCFRILEDWQIEYVDGPDNNGMDCRCEADPEIKKAKIYICECQGIEEEKASDGVTPYWYYLHEILHVAFKAADNHAKEELFIQDIIEIIKKKLSNEE